MRKAVIDLGTNTFNLVIAEMIDGRIDKVYSAKLPVLLGMGGINDGYIAEEAMKRAKEALSQFKATCDEYSVGLINGIGTSALRVAKNSKHLLDYASTLNITVEIVDGEREAELIFEGVSLSHSFKEPSIIMDIGGGSTEFIQVNSNGVQSMISLEMGVSRIYQLLGQPKEYTSEHFKQMKEFLVEVEKEALASFSGDVLVGSSGSFETLYELTLEARYPKGNTSVEIPIEKLRLMLEKSLTLSYAERMKNPWIVPIRKKMLPIAAFQLLWILDKFNTRKVFVSPYSLKEGAISVL